MIEQGIVALLNAAPAVTAITAQGGFLGTLPPNAPQPNWAYTFFGKRREIGLLTPGGLARVNLQIDCIGTPNDVVNLAAAIDVVMNGFRGRLTDPDSTYVDSIFLEDQRDFPEDPEAKTFRRMSEYLIYFAG